jgi:hypothetical protein
MNALITATELADLAAELAGNPDTTTGEWYNFARLAMRCADHNAYGFPTILTPGDITPGVTRCRVQPYIQLPRTASSSSPFRLPVTFPGTVENCFPEVSGGPFEYVYVSIDSDLCGEYPFTNLKQQYMVSRGELHAETCTCAACNRF